MAEKSTYKALEQKAQALESDVLELQHVEKALQECEERFRLLYESSPLGYQSLDKDGNLIEVNQAWLDTLGYTREEVINKNFGDFLHSDWVDHFKENFPRFKAIGEILGVEFGMVKKDGTSALISFNGKIGRDEKGDFKQTHCILQDITKHKEMEEALRQSEEKHRKIVENSNDGICIVQDSEMKFANLKTANMLGYSVEEIIGSEFLHYVHPHDHLQVIENYQEFMSEKKDYHRYEIKINPKDGTEIFVELNTSSIEFDGRRAGLIFVRDITERKQAEQAIKESEGKLRAIFEAAENVSIVMSKTTSGEYFEPTICEFSPGSEKIFGYKAEDVLGKPVSILHPPENAAQFKEMHVRMKEGRVGFSGEVTLKKESGEKCPALMTVHPLYNKKGELYAAFGISIDISEQKKLENQLQQTHKMEALGTLAGGIAHEFNNILGIIVGNTELAMEGVPEWNTSHYNLEEIRTASLRARDVVKQILAFSRQASPELKPVSLSIILKESLKLLRSSIPTSIEIRQDILDGLDTIQGDPTQINQVIINLCMNAVYVMRDKGGSLEIRMENEELGEESASQYSDLPQGLYVKIIVCDTGCGMAQEVLDRIFDPFYTTKEVDEGSGMGLAVVYGIVKNHGGDIKVESEPGKGTTVCVLFPVTKNEVKAEIEATKPHLNGSERILFIDDEESLVFAATQNLEGLGYEVVTARNPITALEIFKNAPAEFDLVITDMAMPEMTGDRFAEAVLKTRGDIPVILCTGFSEQIFEEKVLNMGISALIMKPYLVSEIASAMRTVLDKGKEDIPGVIRRILVVDDEEQMRSTLRQMLESSGYEVVEAPDGKVALWLYKENPTDIIIMDLIMPEKEGIETIGELKQLSPEVKIIAISGGGQGDPTQYLDIAEKVGADRTLAKPFEKEALLNAVKDLLN